MFIYLQKVSIHVHPAFIPPYIFPIGDVAITYTATDPSSNQASCTFHIKVIGKSSHYLGRFGRITQFPEDFASPLSSTTLSPVSLPNGIKTYSNPSFSEAYVLF